MAATTQVFRVMVDEFPGGNQQAADSLKEALLDDDYLNVEVVEQPDGKMRVLMGSFPTEADAKKPREEYHTGRESRQEGLQRPPSGDGPYNRGRRQPGWNGEGVPGTRSEHQRAVYHGGR